MPARANESDFGRIVLKSFFCRNWFVLALPFVIALAWFIPEWGANGGRLHSEVTTRAGVAVIFLLQGFVLPLTALRQGAKNWRLHLIVQSFTFVIFPLIGLGLDALFGQRWPPDLRLGFLFLCVLPSTISTSVVLTSVAGGNTAGAIFNAALSNLIGVFLTPLWVAFLIKKGGQSLPVANVLQDILLLLLAPLALGQCVRLGLSGWADQQKKNLGHLSSGLILFLVFAAFCNSVKQGFWSAYGAPLIFGAALGVLLVFVIAVVLVEFLARLFGLARPDRIVASFCAPQKTIASGIPLAKAIFGLHPGLGLILLPLLFYHPLQLIVCSIWADRLARQKNSL